MKNKVNSRKKTLLMPISILLYLIIFIIALPIALFNRSKDESVLIKNFIERHLQGR